MGKSVHTVNKNPETFVVASKEIGVEVNADKTKYMVMSRDQNARRTHDVKTDNKFLWKGGTVQIFGNKPSESKLYSGGK